jgi:hypothetical protein
VSCKARATAAVPIPREAIRGVIEIPTLSRKTNIARPITTPRAAPRISPSSPCKAAEREAKRTSKPRQMRSVKIINANTTAPTSITYKARSARQLSGRIQARSAMAPATMIMEIVGPSASIRASTQAQLVRPAR